MKCEHQLIGVGIFHFNKFILLSDYYEAGALLNVGNTEVNEADMVPALLGPAF